jgi:hypothetical protein
MICGMPIHGEYQTCVDTDTVQTETSVSVCRCRLSIGHNRVAVRLFMTGGPPGTAKHKNGHSMHPHVRLFKMRKQPERQRVARLRCVYGNEVKNLVKFMTQQA